MRRLLLALDASRDVPAAFEDNWRRLWQLLREAKAADVVFEGPYGEPWHYQKDGVGSPVEAPAALAAGDSSCRSGRLRNRDPQPRYRNS